MHRLRAHWPAAALLLVGALAISRTFERSLGLPPSAATVLCIVLVAAVLWLTEWVPLFVTGFVVLLLEQVTLAPHIPQTNPSVFLAPFFSNIILLFLGGFVLSRAFHRYVIDERLARWVLSRVGSEPSRLLGGVMAISAFLSMWMSNTASTAMMVGVLAPVVGRLDADDPFRKALLLGTAFSANLGGLGTPIGTPPNAIVMTYLERTGDAPSFLGWMVIAVPFLTVMLVVCWNIIVRFYPAQVSWVELGPAPQFQWSWKTRAVIVMAVLTIVGWLTGDLHGLKTGTVALFPIVVLFGTRILNVADFRTLPWDVLILTGGGLSLGLAVEVSGLATAFIEGLAVAETSPSTLLVMVGLSAAILTMIMSNTATANLVAPVLVGLTGIALAPLLTVLAYTCSVVMVLPVSTPPNAIVMGSGFVQNRDMLRSGGWVSVFGLLGAVSLGLLWPS